MKNASENTIPDTILNQFLETKIRDTSDVVNSRCHFLWNRDNIERYRVDVWVEEYIQKWDLDVKKIGYSFFVHYNNETEEITDKTMAGASHERS